MPRVKLQNGIHLDYIDFGARDGIPVLLIHGYLDSWRIWEATLRFLDPAYRIIAPTLRGFGDSDKPEDGYEMSDFARDIDDFMSRIGIGSAIVVGHSMGGLIAHQIAVEYPHRVRKLVLIGTAATASGNSDLAGSAMDAVMQLTDPVASGFAREAQREQVVTEVPDTLFDGLVHESEKVPARVWKGAMMGMLNEDHRLDLNKIKAPTLICYGDGDIFFSMRDQHELVDLIPNSGMRIYHSVGHGVQWEVPEDLAKDLNEFFAS